MPRSVELTLLLPLAFFALACVDPVAVKISGQVVAEDSNLPLAGVQVVVQEVGKGENSGLLGYFLGTYRVVAETESGPEGSFEIELTAKSDLGIGYRGCETDDVPWDFIDHYVDRETYERQPQQTFEVRVRTEDRCSDWPQFPHDSGTDDVQPRMTAVSE